MQMMQVRGQGQGAGIHKEWDTKNNSNLKDKITIKEVR
jgi:hypothetical protein